MPDRGREIGPPGGLDGAEARIRDALRAVRPLAADRLEELQRPLPPGTDYRPAALFVSGCESARVDVGSVLPFTAAIHALDLACRSLARLMELEEYPPRRKADGSRRDDDGLRLLLADGLLITAHGFLPALEPGAFRTLCPLLVEHLGALVPAFEAAGGAVEAVVETQRLLARMAARCPAALPGADPGAASEIESVRERVDEALTAWRGAGDRAGRLAAAGRLERCARAIGGARADGEREAALARYVSLVREPLGVTCGPGEG